MNPALPQAVVNEMARRDFRMHQLLWREIRRYWNQYPQDVQDRIRELGWEPPRPERDENDAPIFNNNAGEDFLYMHRQLIQRVNGILIQVGDPAYPQVEGWVRLPEPGDRDFPVPPAWFDPGSHPIVNRYISRIKSDIVYDKYFRYWEKTFTDSTFLRDISLGTLGGLIDYYLMNPFRRRWAAAPGATRPAVNPVDAPAIEPVWDDPRYDFLSDYYAMHVNPIYWRFLGWIDDRLEEWKYANGVFGDDFWVGTWVGILPDVQTRAGQAEELTPDGAAGLAAMEDLARTIAGTGVSSLQEVGQLDPNGSDMPQSGGHGNGGSIPADGGHGHGAVR
jgi:hypothetical protein